jgi:hypothetical protein
MPKIIADNIVQIVYGGNSDMQRIDGVFCGDYSFVMVLADVLRMRRKKKLSQSTATWHIP